MARRNPTLAFVLVLLLSLGGCVGDFLGEAQIDQRIDAWLQGQDAQIGDGGSIDSVGPGDGTGADAVADVADDLPGQLGPRRRGRAGIQHQHGALRG